MGCSSPGAPTRSASGSAAMKREESRVCRCSQDAGASPLFPPVQAPQDLELAVADLTETVHQSPECFGLSRSRWWLEGLRQTVPWLSSLSLPGICQLLDRLHIAYKRGRRYVHSPDPDYPVKSARLRSAWQEVLKDPTSFVLLYQDELTYYRCPTVFCDYATAGSHAPLAAQGIGYNTSRGISGCFGAYTGRLITRQSIALGYPNFFRYLQPRETAYGAA